MRATRHLVRAIDLITRSPTDRWVIVVVVFESDRVRRLSRHTNAVPVFAVIETGRGIFRC